jgi:putative NADPH-quinone reductase
MLQIMLILAHPNPKSFNHAIAENTMEALQNNGHAVIFHDLYQEKFDPLLFTEEIPGDAKLPAVIQKHCDEIASVDGIVIVHPNWWWSPPAILKGWIDRVFRAGVVYKFVDMPDGKAEEIGLLKGKKAILFNTADAPPEAVKQVFGDWLENYWRKIVFQHTGVTDVSYKMFGPVLFSTLEMRQGWLQKVRSMVGLIFP